jgi:membrane protein
MAWWERLSNRRVLAHLLRAVDRFTYRLGNQFAAGIAYYSIVALVPVVMLGFSGLGLVFTVIRPQTAQEIDTWIDENVTLTDPAMQAQLGSVVDSILDTVTDALRSWWAIGGVGLLIALWLGSAWVGHLKRAVRVQLREELGFAERHHAWPVELLANLGMFLVMLVGVLLSVAIMPTTSLLSEDLRTALHLPGWIWSTALSLLLSVVIGTGLFWVMFRLFAPSHIRRRALWLGSLLGAGGLIVIQLVATGAISLLSRNLSAALFGPMIVLMLFMNVFATWVLFVAAWIGTFDPPAVPLTEEESEEADMRALAEEFEEEREDASSGSVGLVGGLVRLGVLGVSAVVLRRIMGHSPSSGDEGT